MKRIFFFIFFTLFFLQSIFGCSIKQSLISKFDKTEYVFIGEVIGYTEPIEFQYKNKAFFENKDWYKEDYKYASGLIVKVKESVYLPKTPKTYFEVFPLKIDSACFTLGISKSELKKKFPINLEISVVIGEATSFPHVLENGNFRLEYKFASSNVIASNVDKNNKHLTSASSIFEYSQLDKDFNVLNTFPFDFEVRKDLLRLQLSKTQSEKDIIINRLLQNPTLAIDYLELLKTNIENQSEVLRLYEKRLRFENDFYLKFAKKQRYSEEDIQKFLNDAKIKMQSSSGKRKSKSK
jgi:hypothetical protein